MMPYPPAGVRAWQGRHRIQSNPWPHGAPQSYANGLGIPVSMPPTGETVAGVGGREGKEGSLPRPHRLLGETVWAGFGAIKMFDRVRRSRAPRATLLLLMGDRAHIAHAALPSMSPASGWLCPRTDRPRYPLTGVGAAEYLYQAAQNRLEQVLERFG